MKYLNLKDYQQQKPYAIAKTSNISQQAIVYGGLKYDADTTALVVENKNILIFLET